MEMRVPPLEIKIMLESNPLKSRIFVRRLAVHSSAQPSTMSMGILVPVSGAASTGADLEIWIRLLVMAPDMANTILYYTILYYTILYYTILYYTTSTILYYTMILYYVLHYTILYYTILYYTILYYTILYYTLYTVYCRLWLYLYSLYSVLYTLYSILCSIIIHTSYLSNDPSDDYGCSIASGNSALSRANLLKGRVTPRKLSPWVFLAESVLPENLANFLRGFLAFRRVVTTISTTYISTFRLKQTEQLHV